jgi:predicted transcriptional regulator
MDEISEEDIIHFYNILLANMKKKKIVIKKNSVFITLIDAYQRTVLQIINDSAIPAHTLTPDSIKKLLEQKLIKKTDESVKKYIITARGIWTVEKKKNLINEISLLDYFDEKKFSITFEKTADMEFREKVVIFSMIATRVFSKESWLNLQAQSGLQNHWKEIFDLSAQKLHEMGVLTEKNKIELYYRSAHDPPAVSLTRRLPDMQKHTKYVYQLDGNLRYWLEMPEYENDFKEKLAELFSMVFKEKLTFENLDLIYDFCSEISHTKSIFVFDLNKHKFSSPKYDDLVKEALIKGIKEYN